MVAGSNLQSEVNKRKPFESAEQEALLNIVKTASDLMGPLTHLLREHGLSSPQYNILRILAGEASCRGRRQAALPCLEIAARMLTREPDVTRLLDRLEHAGYVRRNRSEGDRRVVMVALTAGGRALLKRLDGPVKRLHARALGHMTKQELAQINLLMIKVRS